jgi:hypothetical protein
LGAPPRLPGVARRRHRRPRIYAAVQRLEKERAKAEFAQFRADVESEAAKAKVSCGSQEALQATHAQEALDDLTTRNAALSARYERLRHANAGSGAVPSLSSAAKRALAPAEESLASPTPLLDAWTRSKDRVLAVLAN